MPAPKGNQNAAKEGTEKKYRVRLPEKADHAIAMGMSTYERGVALIGYIMWKESPEHDENSFLQWMKEKTDFGQYNEEN